MQLPKLMSQWANLLSLFPEDVALTLGHWLRRLAPCFGELTNALQQQGAEEPDGYSGLSRRAKYERLLISEWALADTYPEEFLRRAANREQLFFEPAKKEHREARHSVVLFDTGPDQLGNPRLVQLALLILLARRAERAGAAFSWGIVQDEQCVLHSAVDETSIKQWLAHRSMHPPSTGSLEAWRVRLAETAAEDIWLAGSEQLKLGGPFVQASIISEPLTAPEAVSVCIQHGAQKHSVNLALPNNTLRTRIIRNPFTQKKRIDANGGWNSKSSWVVSLNGRKIACQSADGRIAIHSIPNSPRSKPGKVRYFDIPSGQELVALNLTKNRLSVICQDSGHWFFHHFPGATACEKKTRTQAIRLARKPRCLEPFYFVSDEKSQTSVMLLDAHNQLRTLIWSGNESLFRTIAKDVICFEHSLACSYYARHNHGNKTLEVVWYAETSTPCKKHFPCDLPREARAFGHASGPWYKGSIGLFAFECSLDRWRLIRGRHEFTLTTEADARVVGALPIPKNHLSSFTTDNSAGAPCLILLDTDRRTLTAVSEYGCQTLMTFPRPVSSARINPRQPYLHYMDEADELVTVNVWTAEELLRLEANK